jgi:spore maturation protein CgeB
MRILFVAPQWDYSDWRRGRSYEDVCFRQALEGMGHDVIPFDFGTEYELYGRRQMNKSLVEVARERKPDLAFFFFLAWHEIKRSAVRAISRSGIPTFNWFADDHWRFDRYSSFYAPAFDWVSTTDVDALPKYEKLGYSNALLTQWACNKYSYHRVAQEKWLDVSFVGQPHGTRPELIEELRNAGIDVACYGHGWSNGRVSHQQMLEVFSGSRINLNLSNSSSPGRVERLPQIKGRVFEVPGAGGFLLTETAYQLDRYLTPGKDCAVFDSTVDLVDKIRYYLADDVARLKIELAGERRVLAEHTYDHRFADLFARMGLPA